jgi:hypothetical protein
MSRMRDLGKEFGDRLLDTVREWIAIIGGLGSGGGIAVLFWNGDVTSVPGILCLVLGVCTFVAAFFGMRDRDLGGWAGAFIAFVLGIATFILSLAATGG